MDKLLNWLKVIDMGTSDKKRFETTEVEDQ